MNKIALLAQKSRKKSIGKKTTDNLLDHVLDLGIYNST